MNKKYALPTIAMVAVIMGMSAFAPAMASPNDNGGEKHNPKVAICHFDNNLGVWEADKMVNAHALIAHQEHGDKLIAGFDDATHITVASCLAMNA